MLTAHKSGFLSTVRLKGTFQKQTFFISQFVLGRRPLKANCDGLWDNLTVQTFFSAISAFRLNSPLCPLLKSSPHASSS